MRTTDSQGMHKTVEKCRLRFQNPKSKAPNPRQIQNPKFEIQNEAWPGSASWSLVLWILNLSGIWDLGFGVSVSRDSARHLLLLLLSLLPSAAAASSGSWHVPEAVLRFTIEADPNQPQAPGVDISGKKSSDVNWSGAYYRIDGKTYKRAIAMTCPGKASYACKEDLRRFVALIGVREDAGESASIVFEVWAGTRKLCASPPMTRYSTPIGIDVRIPPRIKRIELVATGSSSQGHHWAGWVNPGFPARDDSPRVGHVTLPVPGFDPSKYEVVVVTANGGRIPSTRLSVPEEGKVEQLFFGGQGWSTYYAYWVPKDKYEPEPTEWLPNAGLVLETRRADKARQRECEDWPGLVKVWNQAGQSVGRTLVTGIHHGFPVHPSLIEGREETARNSLALYRYTGFFEAGQTGEYVFATASNWGSHLLVDDKLVVSWPGNHDYRQGIKGQKQGKVVLQPGVHKIDYFNYSPWGTMFTLAAWQPPGGKLGVMTNNDFGSTRGYVVTSVECNPAAEQRVSFDWSVVDDWRLDRDKVGLVRMRFQAIPERGAEGKGGVGLAPPNSASGEEAARHAPPYSCRWTFDDGVVKTGRTVERVFLDSGKHTVTVQMRKGNLVLAETRQVVYAGGLAEKVWVEPRDPNAFRREIPRIDSRRAPIRDVVRLYTLGNEMPEPSWRDIAVPILLERAGELIGRPEYQPLRLELGQHLSSAAVQQYDQALSLYTTLLEKTRQGTPIRQQTMVLAGELLLRCLGKTDAALRLLDQARWEKAPDRTWTVRLGQARAEALLALGDMNELEAQMRQLRESSPQKDLRRQEIRRAGLLDQASFLARLKDAPVQWDYAMDNVQTLLREEPDRLLAPGLNLVRLDVHLARGEYRIARYLAERVAKLDLTPFDRAQVLVRHVRALCALGDLDAAKKALEELNAVFPNSEQVSQAQAMVVQAATKARSP
jgi:tetratricopeptide (TPR) repeat protein